MFSFVTTSDAIESYGEVAPTGQYHVTRFKDDRNNYDRYRVTIAYEPRWPYYLDGNVYSYWAMNTMLHFNYGDDGVTQFIDDKTSEVTTHIDDYELLRMKQFEFSRTELTNAYANFIFDHNGLFRLYDIYVEEQYRPSLDPDSQVSVDMGSPAPTQRILDDKFQDICQSFDSIRTQGLPIFFNWSAVGVDSTVMTSTKYGLVTDSTSLVNCIDQSYTSRTADSPGGVFPGYRCGIGAHDEDWGKKIPVGYAILASAAGADGTIRLVGPDGFADNYREFTVPNNTTAWYVFDKSDATKVYLNSAAANNLYTTSMNKIDIMFKTSNGAATIVIHSICLWLEDQDRY